MTTVPISLPLRSASPRIAPTGPERAILALTDVVHARVDERIARRASRTVRRDAQLLLEERQRDLAALRHSGIFA